MDIGDWVIGIRSNDLEVVELLRAVLRPALADGAQPFPNLSLYRGADSGRTRELHRLYRRGHLVLRTRSLGHLVRATVMQLSTFAAPPAGFVRLRGELFLGARGAALVNHPWRTGDLSDRRLARAGWRRADGITPLLDPETNEIVVAELFAGTDDEALAGLDRDHPARAGDEPVKPGRYPLHAVLLAGSWPRDGEPVSPAQRLVAVAGLFEPASGHYAATDLTRAAATADRCVVVDITGYESDEILDALGALSR